MASEKVEIVTIYQVTKAKVSARTPGFLKCILLDTFGLFGLFVYVHFTLHQVIPGLHTLPLTYAKAIDMYNK